MAQSSPNLKGKKITLVVNDYDGRAVRAVESLRAWCETSGVEVFQTDGSPHAADDASAVVVPDCAPANCDCDLIVALGGDGTIIRAAHECASTRVPLLGIKFGRLGFLSGAPAEDLVESVQSALEGSAQIERRALMKVEAYAGDRLLGTHYALNEALVARHTEAQVITTKLCINGHKIYELRGDGIIVSTATGSTAYALSAGGPILSPESRAMALVPLASHTLISRAIVTAPKDTVRLHLPDPEHNGAILSIDGQVVMDNVYLERSVPAVDAPFTRIETGICPDKWVSLVKTSSRLFFDTLATEFYRRES
ncbi:MAG: NAD(+)/NADH kinase [Coriobacteriia bacterium]|nr:NAD(+)/NADH kinase [Coriobacteriia bacterium]MCL2536838.1 NAD(+)/NADH kinase [Coriobacteriia bacterium]